VNKARILLIHPPVAKPGEPPAGIARLKAAIQTGAAVCNVMDANLEGIGFLLRQEVPARDTWTKTAVKNTERHVHEIRSGTAFKTIGHYNRIVNDLNRKLAVQGMALGYGLGLADCIHPHLSPARSRDLIRCAEDPESNPFHGYYVSRLLPAVEKHAPETVGLSVNFLSQALCTFALIGLLRKEFPRVRVLLGGGLVTSWMRNPGWKNPFQGLIDRCVDGPGESFFASTLGIPEPLMRKPTPDFSDLAGLPYLSPGFVLPYNASTGCFWRRCRFCPERAEGNDYRPIPFGRVAEDLRNLVQVTRPSLVHFLDNALSHSLVNQFIEQPPGVPWYGYLRFNELLADPEYCGKIKESGCLLLKLGIESGDQNVLDRMEKGIRIKTVSKTLHLLKRAGIPVYVYLLFGTPHESEASARKTMHFVLEHHHLIDYLNPAIFNMPVCSEDAKRLPSRPFSEGDLSLYADFQHPLGWSRSKVRHFLDREFRRHPLISGILGRTPKVFTSNHAPFFHRE
jgi:hypothetical protein